MRRPRKEACASCKLCKIAATTAKELYSSGVNRGTAFDVALTKGPPGGIDLDGVCESGHVHVPSGHAELGAEAWAKAVRKIGDAEFQQEDEVKPPAKKQKFPETSPVKLVPAEHDSPPDFSASSATSVR